MEHLEAFERNRRVADDLSSRTLAAIPSAYGRLVYLSTLRDLATGKYVHAGLAALYPEASVEEVLGAAHAELFDRILETPLKAQLADLRTCLEGFGTAVSEQAARWQELEFYRALIPGGAPGYVRELFCSNLEALLLLLRQEKPAALKDASLLP